MGIRVVARVSPHTVGGVVAVVGVVDEGAPARDVR